MDSSKFTSLFDLVDSYLPKTNTQKNGGKTTFIIPSLSSSQPSGSISDASISHLHFPTQAPNDEPQSSGTPYLFNLEKQTTRNPCIAVEEHQKSKMQRLEEELQRLFIEDKNLEEEMQRLRVNDNISETLLALHATRPQIPIPLKSNESPIQLHLKKQIANTIYAKEKKKLEERKQSLKEEMQHLHQEEKCLEEQDQDTDRILIDLVKAIQVPYNTGHNQNEEENISRSSSFDSLNSRSCQDFFKEPSQIKLLPCTTDMSYILRTKIKKGKPSSFARVVCARQKPVTLPFSREDPPPKIVRFDFSEPSPCDIVKASRVFKPAMSCTFKVDITKFFID